MVEYTVYDPATGEILRFGECAEHDWEKQAGEDEALWPIAEKLRDDEWKIVNGKKVRK